MTIFNYALIYISSIIAFLAIDGVWLLVIAKDFYRSRLGDLFAPALPAAAVFYLVYTLGLCIFVVAPALGRGSLSYALMYGALFGFFAYATYDLTNLATLRNWSLTLSVVDMCWGAVLSASVAAISYSIGKMLS
jgi:uncharacterized membrane protein